MADVSLYLHDANLPPRSAVAVAQIYCDLDAGTAFFQPRSGASFTVAEVATCPLGEEHDPPGADCVCGFRAADHADQLLEALHPTLDDLAGAALLSVQLGGFVVADAGGYRGGAQRVIAADLLRWCRSCVALETPHYGPAHLYAVPANGQHMVVALCDQHAQPLDDLVAVSLHDLSNLLGIKPAWASPRAAEMVRSRIERQWAAPQLSGQLCLARTVRRLRMGHVGFVQPEAIRLDWQGRLWINADAPAPQRPVDDVAVAIQRTVDLQLALIATTPEVHVLDEQLSTPCRHRFPRQSRIDRVRGLRHLPTLAAVMQ